MKNSIIFTWMPWSGKSTIWKKLHKELSKFFNINFLDFDDDILEKISLEEAEKLIWELKLKSNWITPEQISNQTVANILKILWDDDFLKLEWLIWEKLNFKNPTILSASWSLPLKLSAMINLKNQWKVIYIDTPIEIIEKRLKLMKTDRIIWMWSEKTLREILEYRKNFYEPTKDYTFKPKSNWHIETTDKEIIKKQQNEIFTQFLDFFKNKVNAQVVLWV
jgi:shikimate kinase